MTDAGKRAREIEEIRARAAEVDKRMPCALHAYNNCGICAIQDRAALLAALTALETANAEAIASAIRREFQTLTVDRYRFVNDKLVAGDALLEMKIQAVIATVLDAANAELGDAIKHRADAEPEWRIGYRSTESGVATVVEGIIDKGDYDALKAEVERLRAATSAEAVKERGITWLAAQMTVAMVCEDAARFHDGDFKTGMEAALEEVTERLEMEARGEPSSGKGLCSDAAKAAYDRAQAQKDQGEQG